MEIKNAKEFLLKIQKEENKKKTKKDVKMSSLLLEDRKNVLNLKILVGVDVSGSISRAQFCQFMRQIDAIRGLSVVKVLETDTKVVALYNYYKTSQNQVMRLQGGGGTEFTEAFQSARSIQPNAMLFLTDGEIEPAPIRDPGFPVGWILCHGGKKPPFSFGEVLFTLPPVHGE